MATNAEMDILRAALLRGEPVELEEAPKPRARWYESGQPPRDFAITPEQLVELRGRGGIAPT